MIELVLCPRTANGVKIPNKPKVGYKCLDGYAKELANVLEATVLCGARNPIEFEKMQEMLYDPEIGGRTILEQPQVKNRKGELVRVDLNQEFAR